MVIPERAVTCAPMAMFRKKNKPVSLEHAGQLDELLGTHKSVLVDFYQTNCQPCRVMDGIINEIADESGDEAVVVKVNLAHVPELFEKFKIKSTPTFVVMNWREGANTPTQRFRASGLVKKDVLTAAIKSGLPKS